MGTLVLSFAIILLAVLGLAAGVMLGRAPLRGSCGGHGCELCATCPRRQRKPAR